MDTGSQHSVKRLPARWLRWGLVVIGGGIALHALWTPGANDWRLAAPALVSLILALLPAGDRPHPLAPAKGREASPVSILLDRFWRRRRRQRAAESHAHVVSLLRATLESTADGILVVAADGKITSFNRQFSTLWKLPEEIMAAGEDARAIEWVLGQLKAPERFVAKVRELYAHPEAESFDVLQFKDGRIFERYSRPQRVDGRTIGRVWSFRDVTVREQAVAALRNEKTFSESMINGLPGLCFLLDARGRYRRWNVNFEKVTGYSAVELARPHPPIPFVGSERQLIIRQIKKAFAGGTAEMEAQLVSKDGRRTPYYFTSDRVTLEGQPFLLGIGVDITERKQTEDRIHTQRQLAFALASARSLPEGLQACLDAAIKISRLDAGGIYLVNEGIGGLDLFAHQGFSPEFIEGISHYKARSDHARLVMLGEPVYGRLETLGLALNESLRRERVRFLAVIPVQHAGYVIACLHVASHTTEELSPVLRLALETVAAEAAHAIARLKAEAALSQSEARYRELIENQGEGVAVVDTGECFTFANPAGEAIFGVSRRGLLGRTLAEFMTPDQFALVQEQTRQRRAGEKNSYEMEIIRPDGQRRWLRVTGVPRTDPTGRLAGTLGVFADITGRKQAEAALNYERELLRTLLDHSSDQIYFKDAQSRFIKASQAHADSFGVASPEELIGKTDFDFFTEVHARPAFEDEQEIIRTGRPMIGKVEKEFWQDGREDSWVLTTKMPFRNQAGVIVGTFGISKNITALKVAEAALQKLQRFQAAILQAVSYGIHGIDRAGNITFENPAAARMLGWEVNELIGRPEHPTIHHHHPDGSAYPVERCRVYATLQDAEFRRVSDEVFWRKDGSSFPVEYSVSPLHDSGGAVAGAIVVFADITERKAAEEAIRTLNASLEERVRARTVQLELAKAEADRANRAKSEFLSRMSHELRTPLNAILGFAQLLELDALPGDSPARVRQILGGGRHLLDLINEVLDIARIESGRLSLTSESIPVQPLLREVLELIHPLADRRRIRLTADLASFAEWHVRGDRQRLKQVLLNLLSNAVKFNRDDGEVRVRCEIREAPASDAPGPGSLRLLFTDTGPGITAGEQARLFQPFERLDAKHGAVEGTGLGLALCKSLVEAMGGTVGLLSAPGQGSTFWVELPLAGPATNSPIPTATLPSQPERQPV